MTRIAVLSYLSALSLAQLLAPGLLHAQDRDKGSNLVVAQATDPQSDCDSDDSAKKLKGCTKLIKKGGLDAKLLAIAHSRRSDVYLESSKFGLAINDRERAIELDPDQTLYSRRLSAAYHLKGLYENERKKIKSALESYTEAIRHDDSNHAAFEARGLTLAQIGQIDGAIDDLTLAHRLDASNPAYTRELAELFKRRAAAALVKSKHDIAITDLTAAIGLIESDASSHVMRADAYRAAEELRRAANDLDKALELEPDLVDALVRRGEMQMQDGRYATAAEDFSRALVLDAANTGALIGRALTYEALDRFSEAKADYQSVLKLQRRNRIASASLKRLTSIQSWKKKMNAPVRLASTGTGEFETHENYDVLGQERDRIRDLDLAGCEAACGNDSQCVAFAYDKWNRWCFLKGSATEFRLSPKATAGLKPGLRAPARSSLPIGILRYRGKYFPGSGFRRVSTPSFESCELLCDSATECIAYTFYRPEGRCELFASVGEYFSRADADSGAKHQGLR